MCFRYRMPGIEDTFSNYPAFNSSNSLANGTTIALGQPTSNLAGEGVLGTEALLSMRGWLLKRKRGCFDPKSRTLFGSAFNKRFFWIDSSIRLIYYSESKDKSKRVSFIPFNKLVSVSTVTEPMAINSARPGWVYGMEVRTTDRGYELWARTPAEAKLWLDVLAKAASIGRSYQSATSSVVPGVPSTRYGDTVSPSNNAGSRRGSATGSIEPILEQNTVPVVAAAPQIDNDDDKTVVISKENAKDFNIRSPPPPTSKFTTRSPKAELPALAPSKWDDWDR